MTGPPPPAPARIAWSGRRPRSRVPSVRMSTSRPGGDDAPASDVIHRRAGGLVLALDQVGDGGLREHRADGGGRLGEDALGVGAEAPVEQLDDLEHGDLM